MSMIVEQLVEWRMAGEIEVLGENLPQRHFVHYKSHMTRPGLETRATAVGSQRLTTWAMARPVNREDKTRDKQLVARLFNNRGGCGLCCLFHAPMETAGLCSLLPGNISVNIICTRNSRASWSRSGDTTEQQWVGVMWYVFTIGQCRSLGYISEQSS
jgi:hypothetical protein